MKSPMHQRPDDEARELTEKFIAKYVAQEDAVAGAQAGDEDAPGHEHQVEPGRLTRQGRAAAPLDSARVASARDRAGDSVRVGGRATR